MSASGSGAAGAGSPAAPAPVKGILKNKKGAKVQPPKDVEGGIQWDEMSILMTEHPANKDYGHMKIDEPKTPYHEMLLDEEGPSTPPQAFSPETLAQKVQEASTQQAASSNEWPGTAGEDSSEEEMSEELKEHKRQFSDWRKKHYNEFFAVKRAKELMAQEEEELMDMEPMEKHSSVDEDVSLMEDDQSTP